MKNQNHKRLTENLGRHVLYGTPKYVMEAELATPKMKNVSYPINQNSKQKPFNEIHEIICNTDYPHK